MKVPYHIDLRKYSLQKFKKNLASRVMIPSRKVLQEHMGERFDVLQNAGITNLKLLVDALKTKPKIEDFSIKTGLTTQYLTILSREARSYLPNPFRLDKFSGIPSSALQKLAVVGIKNTRHLFDAAQDKVEREVLVEQLEISADLLNELVGLSDLARLFGVGPVFARMIYGVGVHSVKEFIQLSPQDFIDIYEEQTQQKADFSVGDIEFSLHLGRELSIAADI